ncbi:MAG: MrtC family glutamic-type intramembrane protease [Polyangiaceae bacterium]|nr:MrtC family glutamic-type intramembrane protease [Polyangiaceae bacterium]
MSPTARIVIATTLTTALVSIAAYALPTQYAATSVGITFLAAVYVLVLRNNSAFIKAHGLSLGGVLEPGHISLGQLLRSLGRAAAWAFGTAAVIFPLFWIGFVTWWQPEHPFSFVRPESYFDDILGQFVAIALPEEAFYRGYLQSSLDSAWASKPGGPKRHINLLGAQIGWSTPVTCAVFAIGHFITEPNPQRLAVFFPSLLFCWLRSRTGGIGAAVILHALANLFSSTLGRGYGLFH